MPKTHELEGARVRLAFIDTTPTFAVGELWCDEDGLPLLLIKEDGHLEMLEDKDIVSIQPYTPF